MLLDAGQDAGGAQGLIDFQDALVDAIVGDTFPGQQMIQMTREVRVGSVESADCNGCGHSESLI